MIAKRRTEATRYKRVDLTQPNPTDTEPRAFGLRFSYLDQFSLVTELQTARTNFGEKPMNTNRHGCAADALAGDNTTRPSEAVAPTSEYLRAREESTR